MTIAQKPAVGDGRIEVRYISHLTVMFRHDVIDRAPAARFVHSLVELIDSGYGVGEDQTTTSTDINPAGKAGSG